MLEQELLNHQRPVGKQAKSYHKKKTQPGARDFPALQSVKCEHVDVRARVCVCVMNRIRNHFLSLYQKQTKCGEK